MSVDDVTRVSSAGVACIMAYCTAAAAAWAEQEAEPEEEPGLIDGGESCM